VNFILTNFENDIFHETHVAAVVRLLLVRLKIPAAVRGTVNNIENKSLVTILV